jgi:membrane-bound metal-dependent hydrolase YbcI (DUF457 family)
MPGYKGHLVGGLTAYLLTLFICSWYQSSYQLLAEWLLCALLGSLFPDVDVKSKGQNIFYVALFIGSLILLYQQRYVTLSYIAIVALIPLITRHRGLLHRFWFIILAIAGSAYALASWYPALSSRIYIDAGFFLIGAASHLYLDLGLKRMFKWS